MHQRFLTLYFALGSFLTVMSLVSATSGKGQRRVVGRLCEEGPSVNNVSKSKNTHAVLFSSYGCRFFFRVRSRVRVAQNTNLLEIPADGDPWPNSKVLKAIWFSTSILLVLQVGQVQSVACECPLEA